MEAKQFQERGTKGLRKRTLKLSSWKTMLYVLQKIRVSSENNEENNHPSQTIRLEGSDWTILQDNLVQPFLTTAQSRQGAPGPWPAES